MLWFRLSEQEVVKGAIHADLTTQVSGTPMYPWSVELKTTLEIFLSGLYAPVECVQQRCFGVLTCLHDSLSKCGIASFCNTKDKPNIKNWHTHGETFVAWDMMSLEFQPMCLAISQVNHSCPLIDKNSTEPST